MRGPSPLYIEERHRALGRDATFSWSRTLTHPPRCSRTRHRDRHLVSDFVGPPSWCRGGRHLGSEVVGAAILVLWGPPSWCRGGRHLVSEVTSKALKWGLYYYVRIGKNLTEIVPCDLLLSDLQNSKGVKWPCIVHLSFPNAFYIYESIGN